MAYNYLDLTNEVISRFNEVPLTSSGFSSSRGVQTQCKNAVNEALRYIDSKEYGWPFNHATQTDTLVVNQVRYTPPATAKHVDYESFRLVRDPSLNVEGRNLRIMDYNEYLERFVEQEDTTDRGEIPRSVFRTPDNKFGLYPYPDKAYSVKYEYYRFTTELSAATDVPRVPEQFRNVIIDGAATYMYQYRGELQLYAANQAKFDEGVKQMQSILLNRYDYVRSTVIQK